MITIYRPGSKVVLADGIEGVIEKVSIEQECTVMYQVLWWDMRKRESGWFQPGMVTPLLDQESVRVGFHGK